MFLQNAKVGSSKYYIAYCGWVIKRKLTDPKSWDKVTCPKCLNRRYLENYQATKEVQ